MKRITLPVSGAGSNCFYIALAAHFVLLYHNRQHSDKQYQVFQRALNQALDT